jgi:glucokinase
MILAGDVGGTNVRFALFEVEGGKLARKDEKTFRSRDVSGLEQPVEEFLAGRRVAASGIGVAGPVRNGRCEATNLPWVVDAAVLANSLALPRVALVNDLFANALGLGELGPADFAVVNAGIEDLEGNAALIAAGTGLGEAYLVRMSDRFAPQASEGGHASFAPRKPFEIDLLGHLQRTYSHVSFERVLSGPGLAALYAFERSGSGEREPAWLSEEIAASGDASPAVTAAALAGRTPSRRARSSASSRFMAAKPGISRSKSSRRAACSWAAGLRRRSCRSFWTGRFSERSATRGASRRSSRRSRYES